MIYPGVMSPCAGTLTASKPALGVGGGSGGRSLSAGVFSGLLSDGEGDSGGYEKADDKV